MNEILAYPIRLGMYRKTWLDDLVVFDMLSLELSDSAY